MEAGQIGEGDEGRSAAFPTGGVVAQTGGLIAEANEGTSDCRGIGMPRARERAIPHLRHRSWSQSLNRLSNLRRRAVLALMAAALGTSIATVLVADTVLSTTTTIACLLLAIGMSVEGMPMVVRTAQGLPSCVSGEERAIALLTALLNLACLFGVYMVLLVRT